MTLLEDGSMTDPDKTKAHTVRQHPEHNMLLTSHIPLSVIMANSCLTYKGSKGQAKQLATGHSVSLTLHDKFCSDRGLSPIDNSRPGAASVNTRGQTEPPIQPLAHPASQPLAHPLAQPTSPPVTTHLNSISLSKIRKRKLKSDTVENVQSTTNKEVTSLDNCAGNRSQNGLDCAGASVAVLGNVLSDPLLSHPMPAYVGSKENGLHGVLRGDLYDPEPQTAQPGCKQRKPVRGRTKVVMRDSSNIELKPDNHTHDGQHSNQNDQFHDIHRRNDVLCDKFGLGENNNGKNTVGHISRSVSQVTTPAPQEDPESSDRTVSQVICHPTTATPSGAHGTGYSDTTFYITDKFYKDTTPNTSKDTGRKDQTRMATTDHPNVLMTHPDSPTIRAEPTDSCLYIHSRTTENNCTESRNTGKSLETSTALNTGNIGNRLSISDTTSAHSLPQLTSSYDVISQSKLPPKKRRLFYEQDLLPESEPITEGGMPGCDQVLNQRSLPTDFQPYFAPQYFPEAFLYRIEDMSFHSVANTRFGVSVNQPCGEYHVPSLNSESSIGLPDPLPKAQSPPRVWTDAGITPNDVLDLSAKIGALNTQQTDSIKQPAPLEFASNVRSSNDSQGHGVDRVTKSDPGLWEDSRRPTGAVFPVSMTSHIDTYPRTMCVNMDTVPRDQNVNMETLNRETSPRPHNVNFEMPMEIFPRKHSNSLDGFRSHRNEPINLTTSQRTYFEASSKPIEPGRPKPTEAHCQGNNWPDQGRGNFVGRSVPNMVQLDPDTSKIGSKKKCKAGSKSSKRANSSYTLGNGPCSSPNGKTSPAPNGKTSPAPNSKISPAPNGKISPAPNGKTSPAPNGKISPAPNGKTSPAPNGRPSSASSYGGNGPTQHVGDSQLAVEADEDGDLPLHIAVVQNEPDVVKVLVDMMKDAGVSVDYHNQLKQTPLHLAVITKLQTIVRCLLEAGASPNVPDRKGQTCCHLAVSNRTIHCFEILVKFSKVKVDLNSKNYEGLTPLHRAVQMGSTDFIISLLDHGADINLVDGKSGKTPLYLAFECNQPMVADLLLVRGADVNIPTYSGSTVLQAANTRGQHLLTNLINRDGTNSNARDFQNKLAAKVNRTRNKHSTAHQQGTAGNLKRMSHLEHTVVGNRGHLPNHDPSSVILPHSTPLPLTSDQRSHPNNHNYLPMNVGQSSESRSNGLAQDRTDNICTIEPMDT